MKQIKIFRTKNNPEEIENAINAWLEQHERISIISITPVKLGLMQSDAENGLMILYDDGEKRKDKVTEGIRVSEDIKVTKDIEVIEGEGIAEEIKRQHNRINLFESIDYLIDGRYYRDFIEDVSESGLFIKTAHSFPLGKDIVMNLIDPEDKKPFRIEGEIVRALPGGIGVKFKKENSADDDIIQSFLENIQKISAIEK